MSNATFSNTTLPDRAPSPARAFGRFELRRLLGRSGATMTWLAADRHSGQEFMLTSPRVAPPGLAPRERWLQTVRRAARLDHPNLARVVEVGVEDGWPFAAVERAGRSTLDEWLALHPLPGASSVAGWLCDALRGLAFAHEAGVAHLDLQLATLLISDLGHVSVMALGVAGRAEASAAVAPRSAYERAMPLDPLELRGERAAAERDVLACGVLLHRLLAGGNTAALSDVGRVIERIAPLGREPLRLPWTTPLPIAAALRAITDRSTAGQQRLRYRNARTLLGALQGWREAESQGDAGPLARLLDRLDSVGHLPALPGLAARVAQLVGLEGQRTDEIAGRILPDMALSFELLRNVNSARLQGTQVAGSGPVLTLRRVVALVGVDGVRHAANALRSWPGPLDEVAASALRTTMEQVRLAAHAAQALRPAGYDAEVVYLIAVLQNLGRLMLRYHFADEAEQIEQLMRAAPALRDAGMAALEQPGMSEDAAAFAVLGVDTASIGRAVARHWGLGEEVLHMIRRLPNDAPVRKPDDDADVLRITASAANEAIDAIARVPAHRIGAALAPVVQRYGRILRVNARALHDALDEARDRLRADTPAPRCGIAAPEPASAPRHQALQAGTIARTMTPLPDG